MDQRPEHVITNSGALVAAMGGWPSFHDARLLRAAHTKSDLHVTIHVFEMTSEVDAVGYFILTKHHLVTLALVGVVSCDLPDDFDGDILDGIGVTSCVAEGVDVRFESVVASESSWQAVCREVRVLDVAPCDADGRVI